MLHRPHTNPIELFFKRTCVIEVIDLMTTMLTRLILPFIRLIILHIHLLLFSHKHNSLPISFHFFEPHNEYTHIISKHHPIYVYNENKENRLLSSFAKRSKMLKVNVKMPGTSNRKRKNIVQNAYFIQYEVKCKKVTTKKIPKKSYL